MAAACVLAQTPQKVILTQPRGAAASRISRSYCKISTSFKRLRYRRCSCSPGRR